MRDKRIINPNKVKRKTYQSTYISHNNKQFAICAFSHKLRGKHILRLYKMRYIEINNELEVLEEVGAFSFNSEQVMKEFAIRIPFSSTLKILLKD